MASGLGGSTETRQGRGRTRIRRDSHGSERDEEDANQGDQWGMLWDAGTASKPKNKKNNFCRA